MTYTPPDEINLWDAENLFYLRSSPTRIAKLLSHYELYKRIVDVPGAIVECGVYKGASLIRFAQFRSYLENDYARKIIAFDAFGKFPNADLTMSSDREFVERFEESGGEGISKSALLNCFKNKGIANIDLIEGNVLSTVPEYCSKNGQMKIALLHLDLDVFEPTKCCLETLFESVSIGGLIIVDDYDTVEGATKAVDEYISSKGLQIQKAPYYCVPSFIVVDQDSKK